VIVVLVIWNRNRIAEKNKGLYRQIKEQDRLTEELKQQKREETETLQNTEKRQYIALVNQLSDYLKSDRNFANPEINVNKLISALNTNQYALFQATKDVKGQTPMDYVNNMRLDEARQLLDTTDQNIETIVEMSGFNAVNTFYRLFRERYNISPAAYRKIKKSFDSPSATT